MPTTWADCVALDAGLATVPVAAQAALLADAYATESVAAWGSMLDRAVKYKVMHEAQLLLRAGGGGTVGIVLSERLGPAAKTYANPLVLRHGPSEYDTTIWGLRYKALLATINRPGVI